MLRLFSPSLRRLLFVDTNKGVHELMYIWCKVLIRIEF